MKVYIMQGLPGSGKSHLIPSLAPYSHVCSADHYFDNLGKFDPTLLPKAHEECYLRFHCLLTFEQVSEPIVVDNTNLSAWELAPYYRLAEVMDADPEIIRCVCSLKTCIARQTHGVPEWQMGVMSERLRQGIQDIPSWWKVRTVNTGPEEK